MRFLNKFLKCVPYMSFKGLIKGLKGLPYKAPQKPEALSRAPGQQNPLL